MGLKTGGIDSLSRKPKTFFIEMFGEEVWDLAEEIVGSNALSAMRWHARGLTLYDAFRKVFVDAEVAANCR